MASSHASPPSTLDEPLELDPMDWSRQQRYFLMTGLVVPRPIAWVSTLSSEGVANLAPHSYFNVFADDPPHLVFSSGGVKDTMRNVLATREYVVNLVTMELVEEMNFSSTDSPPGEDEFEWSGLARAQSRTVAPPRVAAARACFECRLVQALEAGGSWLAVGRVQHVHVHPEVWRDGRVDPRALDPVCRLAGNYYASLGEIFRVARPYWRDVEGSSGRERMPRAEREA